jgi:hypothetical protein
LKDTEAPIKDLYEAIKQLSVTAERSDNVVKDGIERAEWIVLITYRDRVFEIPFYTHPDMTHVDQSAILYSIGADISTVEQWWEKDRTYIGFVDWCSELGYDEDRISHLKIYQDVINMAKALQEVFGTEYDMLIHYFSQELEF